MSIKLSDITSKFSEREKRLAELLDSISQKDEPSLRILFRETSSYVYPTAFRILNNKNDAEEVTLEVFTQVWEKASDYKPELSTPLSWILMITRSRSIDRLRKEKQKRKFELNIDFDTKSNTTTPEKTSIFSEQQDMVKEALSKLNSNQKQVIELAYFKGFTQSEISRYLDMPLGTVKSTIRKSMSILREFFEASKFE
jgi:RNA polymerase sigma-70 factor (ECF subfamily)